jgi:HlyD family secretion protein
MTATSRRASTRLRWAAALATIGLAAVAAVALLARGPEADGVEGRRQTDGGTWVVVGTTTRTYEVVTSGKLQPIRRVEVPSPANGTVAALQAEWSDAVAAGQLLLRLDSPDLRSRLYAAEAESLRSRLKDGVAADGAEPLEVVGARRRLVAAQSAASTADTRASEATVLFDRGIIARNEMESARTEADNARQQTMLAEEELQLALRRHAPDQQRAARLEAAIKAAELAALRHRAGQLSVVAPIAGVVLAPEPRQGRGEGPAVPLAVGSRVSEGESLLAIGDLSAFSVRGQCREADLAWLGPGAAAEVTVAALPGRKLPARVTKMLGPARDRAALEGGEGEPAYEFLVALHPEAAGLTEAEHRLLRVGGSARIRVQGRPGAGFSTVPLAAATWSPEGGLMVRWRAGRGAAEEMKPLRAESVGVAEVVVAGTLGGEVWVPAQAPEGVTTRSTLRQMLGLE